MLPVLRRMIESQNRHKKIPLLKDLGSRKMEKSHSSIREEEKEKEMAIFMHFRVPS